MAQGHQATHAGLSVRRLHPCLGAEVRGVDFAEPLAEPTITAMKEVWAEHLVLVVPGQAITDQQFSTRTS
jgi:alpha-ketoglutarate-dependent taurine dioxygenase